MKRFLLRNIVPNTQEDVAEELRFHLDMRAEEMMAKGMSSEDAQKHTIESFGDVEAVAAECRSVRVERGRERRRREWFSEWWRDTTFAARTLRRSPVFAATAILTLALGIAGAAAGVTLVNGVLLRPLPYRQPERLAMVWMTGEDNGKLETQWPLSIPNFVDLQARLRSLQGLAAFRSWQYALQGDDRLTASEIVPSARVSSELFEVLGVRPELGRSFRREDVVGGEMRVAIIGNNLWRRRFNASRDVIGKPITLNGTEFTIVGVMPTGFAFPRGAELPGGFQFAPCTELWTPLAFSERELTERGTGNLAVVGRLAENSSIGATRADLERVLKQLLTEYPRYFNPNTGITASTLADQVAEPVRRGLWLLLGAVGTVLLIACLNIGNLLIARTSRREHEFSVRRALGASRLRLLQQLITENVLLAVVGALAGFGFAAAAIRMALSRVPAGLPRIDDVIIDARVIVSTLLLTLIAGVFFGAITVLSDRNQSADVVRGGNRATGGRTQRTGRRILVAAEVALALVLLVGAGLLVDSYARLSSVSPGFEAEGAMTANVLLPIAGAFDQRRDGPQWAAFFAEYERRLSEARGVEAAGGISSLPLSGAVESTNYLIDGAPPLPTGAHPPSADYQVVTPGWFRAARVPLVAGRTFDTRDRSDADGVVVVSLALARAHWPTDAPAQVIGRRINSGLYRTPQTIVGIVGDVRQTSLDAAVKPAIYLPQSQFPYPFLSFVVRPTHAAVSAALVVPAMREQLRAINPAMALAAVRPLTEVLNASLARQRFGMLVTGGFAITALFLAMIGLYGVIATGVAERTREIGVRIALGATRRNVLSTVLREGVGVTVLGVAIGVVAAVGAVQLLRRQLYEANLANPSIYASVALFVIVVALVATLVPALRATRLNPVNALRGE